MSAYTETNANGLRKRVPLMEAFTEAFPELTPVTTAIKKKTGCRTTSPDNNSSKVEVPFKTFSSGEISSVADTEDYDGDVEAEDNEDNKTMIENRIQLIRNGVQTGRITNSVTRQHGTGDDKIHIDHKVDCLRRMRASKEKLLLSEHDSHPEVSSPAKSGYTTRGFASWCRKSETHGDLPINALAAVPTGNILGIDAASDFKESSLNAMLASLWNARQTEGNWHMFGTTDMQTVIDNFLCFGDQTTDKLPIRRANIDSSARKIDITVKSWKSTFGQVAFSLHSKLPQALTLTGCSTTNGSKTVTVSSNLRLYAGMPVVGTGIAAGTRIKYVPTKKTSKTTIYLDTDATASGTVSLAFGETVFAELWDFDFAMLGYVDEVGWQDLENKGGGPRGYADALLFFANLNPQAHGIVRQNQSGFNGAA